MRIDHDEHTLQEISSQCGKALFTLDNLIFDGQRPFVLKDTDSIGKVDAMFS